MTETLMWEAKALPGRGAELLAWALEHADPAAEVYRGGDERVVVIDGTGQGMPAAPPDLLARTPHVWPFERISR
jgi:hypothetical protein